MNYIRLWLLIKPVKRIRALRNKRRARKGKPLLNVDEDIEMNEQVASAIRTVGKIVGGALVSWGYLGDSMVEPIIGLALAAFTVFWSWKAHDPKSPVV